MIPLIIGVYGQKIRQFRQNLKPSSVYFAVLRNQFLRQSLDCVNAKPEDLFSFTRDYIEIVQFLVAGKVYFVASSQRLIQPCRPSLLRADAIVITWLYCIYNVLSHR